MRESGIPRVPLGILYMPLDGRVKRLPLPAHVLAAGTVRFPCWAIHLPVRRYTPGSMPEMTW